MIKEIRSPTSLDIKMGGTKLACMFSKATCGICQRSGPRNSRL